MRTNPLFILTAQLLLTSIKTEIGAWPVTTAHPTRLLEMWTRIKWVLRIWTEGTRRWRGKWRMFMRRLGKCKGKGLLRRVMKKRNKWTDLRLRGLKRWREWGGKTQRPSRKNPKNTLQSKPTVSKNLNKNLSHTWTPNGLPWPQWNQ